MMSHFSFCATSTKHCKHSSKLSHVTRQAGNERINKELHGFTLTRPIHASCIHSLFFMTFNMHNSREEKHETKVRIGFGSLIDNSYASVTVNTPTG